MIVYYNPSTGSINCIIEATNPNITPPNNQGTPLYLDDTEYADLWNNGSPLAHAYLIQNNVPVPAPPIPESVMLSQAQQTQIASINAGYASTISAGFASNATGTSDTYAIDATAYPKWTGILSTIAAGIAPTSITVKDISGKQVTLTQTQFKQFALDGFNFLNAQEQQLWALEDEVNAQTSVPSTPVTWTPGNYTPQTAPSTGSST